MTRSRSPIAWREIATGIAMGIAVMVLGVLLVRGARADSTSSWPARPERVMDRARVLSPEAREQIEQKLIALEHRTTAQMMVVTVPRLPDDAPSLFDLGYVLAHRYPIGTRDSNNGIILMFDMGAHRDKAMIGSGLNSSIIGTDADDIFRDVARPLLRAGKIDEAVEQTVNAFAAKVPVVGEKPTARHDHDDGGLWWLLLSIPLGLAMAGLMYRITRSRSEREARELREREEALNEKYRRESPPRRSHRAPPPFVPDASPRSTRRDSTPSSSSSDDSFGSAVLGGIIGSAIGSSLGSSSSSDSGSSSSGSDSGSSGGFDSGGGDFSGGGGGGDW